MHKLAIILPSLLGFIAVSPSGPHLQSRSSRARVDDFCALTLNVNGPRGEPITSTWIELVDSSGRVVRREKMQGPEHKICDFGFGPHTLRVGTNECFPVEISNLRVVFGFPVTLNVLLNSCGYREQMRSACLVYFRTVDEDHKPLAGVSFSPPLTMDRPAETDSFGRWQGVSPGRHELTFTKPGFAATTTLAQCQRDEEVDVEVVMRRAEGHRP
jgi:hypothetical protein